MTESAATPDCHPSNVLRSKSEPRDVRLTWREREEAGHAKDQPQCQMKSFGVRLSEAYVFQRREREPLGQTSHRGLVPGITKTAQNGLPEHLGRRCFEKRGLELRRARRHTGVAEGVEDIPHCFWSGPREVRRADRSSNPIPIQHRHRQVSQVGERDFDDRDEAAVCAARK